jgi:hypothetical protein
MLSSQVGYAVISHLLGLSFWNLFPFDCKTGNLGSHV